MDLSRQPEATALPSSARVSPLSNYVVAGLGVSFIILVVLVANRRCDHWFLLPLAACGIVAGADVVAWLRRQLDTFDPMAIIGLLWFHGCFLAPLLHVSLDAYPPRFAAEIDYWPPWFGLMGALNAAGLILFKLTQYGVFRVTKPTPKVWRLNDAVFAPSLAVAILLSAAAAVYILIRYQGLHQEAGLGTPEEMANVSWLVMLGDPLPLLITAGLLHFLFRPTRRGSAMAVGTILLLLLATQLLIAGYRGSRSAVILVVFLGTVMCHLRLRKMPLSWVLAGMIALGIPAYYYKFYKRYGTEGLEAITDASYRQTLADKASISPTGFFLGDLARADLQAFMAYRLVEHSDDYELRLGRTYVFAGLMVVPRGLWPSKPSGYYGKVAAGTDLQYGQGTYHPVWRKSSRVYGLQGEVMLNFGLLGVPFIYVVYGAWVGWFRRKMSKLGPADPRCFIVPLLTMATATAAISDADNVMFGFLKHSVLLIFVVVVSSRRWRPRSVARPSPAPYLGGVGYPQAAPRRPAF